MTASLIRNLLDISGNLADFMILLFSRAISLSALQLVHRFHNALPALSDDLSRLADASPGYFDASLRFDDALSRLAIIVSRCTDTFSTFSDMRSNLALSCSRQFFISLKRRERSMVISSLTLMVKSLCDYDSVAVDSGGGRQRSRKP